LGSCKKVPAGDSCGCKKDIAAKRLPDVAAKKVPAGDSLLYPIQILLE
jgi:hypothetical protein